MFSNLEITNIGRFLVSFFCVGCFIVHYPKWRVAIISSVIRLYGEKFLNDLNAISEHKRIVL